MSIGRSSSDLFHGKTKRAFTAFEWIALISILIIGLALIVPNFLEAMKRSSGSASRSDMRTLATAIESYYVDHKSYPAWSLDPRHNANRRMGSFAKEAGGQPTFIDPVGEFADTAGLTTPVAYIPGHFPDPFSPNEGQVISYWGTESGWIIWSAGPDQDYDLSIRNIEQAYNPLDRTPGEYLLAITYDPTNGAESNGDVYRFKQ